jgi:hypothetical protein
MGDADYEGPRCPNHGCPLELTLDQLTATEGRAPCQVSKELFEFEQETNSKEQDKFGQPLIKFNVTGKD